MTKVKIVQVVYVGDSSQPQYLDDKGRVWVLVPVYEANPGIEMKIHDYKWQLLDLPNEP